jgi:hypothetical protein
MSKFMILRGPYRTTVMTQDDEITDICLILPAP